MPKNTVSPMTVKKRLIICFCALLLCTTFLIGRLAWIQLIKAEEYKGLAWQQWTRGVPARSPRGTIFDRNGQVLAGSATANTVVAFPPQIEDSEYTAEKLAEALDMDYEQVLDLVSSNRAAVYVKRQIDEDASLKIQKLGLQGVRFTPESKRYYPNDKLLSQILGFVGIDQGWSGLELKYEDILKGRDGMIISQTDAKGRIIPQGIQHFRPPKDGADLILTIDETIQFIMERELERAMIDYDPIQAMALAVDPFTGEILGMASMPDFNPNHYADYAKETWQIAPIANTFEPGSTFKLVTLSAAIDQGIYNKNEVFYCSGSLRVGGHDIKCWTASRGGHGAIDFLEVVLGSCNPGFITLGQRLGGDTLFEYIHGFGFGVRSDIDLPGEGTGILFTKEQLGPVELATTSFGQGISVTPLQQVMAVSAMINGGNLLQPYAVKETRDTDGNTIEKRETEVIRQVISAQTSEMIKEIMELVVTEGSGQNAAIPGYRIGGKTGTAQKVGAGGRYISGEYIVSFMGFFPAEKPEVLIYIAVDGGKKGAQWGSQVSAPIFNKMAKDIISYLGIAPDSIDEIEAPKELVNVPDITGMTLIEAGEELRLEALIIKPVGEGEVIKEQTPKPGARVPVQTEILVYMGNGLLDEVEIPDLTGRTMRESREILGWMGLKMESNGSGIVTNQNPPPWKYIPVGSTVSLEFSYPN